ncbi:MAG: hypothetical protein L0Z53_24555, partial [Acidobacteriales bacterium]|nr:hypothetical protein [Terriglobales bacterium]
PITLSNTARQVIERMAQTIFMALVATLVAIPIAVLISFLAARNLMHSVRLSVGTMLLTFVMLVIGFWLGSSFLTVLAQAGLDVGKGQFLPPIGALLALVIPGLVVAATVVLLRLIAQANGSKDKRGVEENVAVRVANTVVITLVLVFMSGALAGLCILGGEQIENFANSLRPAVVSNSGTWLANAGADLIWSVGNVLLIVGTLVELFIGSITGLIGGFGLAGVMGALFGRSLRRVNGPISYVIAAILGALSGALVMGAMAALGLWAALLGILPLLIGGILGGQVLQQLINRIRTRQTVVHRDSSERALQWLIFAVGFILVAYFLFVRLSLGRSLVDGTLPPQTALNIAGFGTTVYMFTAVMVGAVLGGISGGLAGLQAAFPLGDLLYNTARTTL